MTYVLDGSKVRSFKSPLVYIYDKNN